MLPQVSVKLHYSSMSHLVALKLLRRPLAATTTFGGRGFSSSSPSSFWSWTTQQRPSWRESKVEAAVLFCVFGVTGSSSVYFVRPCLKSLGIEGSMKDGPWSYRILSFLLVSPIYSVILITVGTLAGRHRYFSNMGLKILKRFVPGRVGEKLKPKSCNNTTKATHADAVKTTTKDNKL